MRLPRSPQLSPTFTQLPAIQISDIPGQTILGAAQLIVEASFRDAEREPRIKALPTIKGFTDEVEGYLLNGEDGTCVFFNQETALCTIYETRPLVCRVFDCDSEWGDPSDRDSDDVQFK